jgi:hypothetical protein
VVEVEVVVEEVEEVEVGTLLGTNIRHVLHMVRIFQGKYIRRLVHKPQFFLASREPEYHNSQKTELQLQRGIKKLIPVSSYILLSEIFSQANTRKPGFT